MGRTDAYPAHRLLTPKSFLFMEKTQLGHASDIRNVHILLTMLAENLISLVAKPFSPITQSEIQYFTRFQRILPSVMSTGQQGRS